VFELFLVLGFAILAGLLFRIFLWDSHTPPDPLKSDNSPTAPNGRDSGNADLRSLDSRMRRVEKSTDEFINALEQYAEKADAALDALQASAQKKRKSSIPLDKMDISYFYSRVTGVTYRNEDDGSSRQSIIRDFADIGDSIALYHEPENPHDANAIAVHLAKNGRKLGYLPARTAAGLVESLDERQFGGMIVEVTGGEEGKVFQGVNLVILDMPKERTQDEVQDWVNAHAAELMRFDETVARQLEKWID